MHRRTRTRALKVTKRSNLQAMAALVEGGGENGLWRSERRSWPYEVLMRLGFEYFVFGIGSCSCSTGRNNSLLKRTCTSTCSDPKMWSSVVSSCSGWCSSGRRTWNYSRSWSGRTRGRSWGGCISGRARSWSWSSSWGWGTTTSGRASSCSEASKYADQGSSVVGSGFRHSIVASWILESVVLVWTSDQSTVVNIGIRVCTVVVCAETVVAAHQLRILLDGDDGRTSMMDLLREAAPKSNQVTDTFGIVPQHVINLQAAAAATEEEEESSDHVSWPCCVQRLIRSLRV